MKTKRLLIAIAAMVIGASSIAQVVDVFPNIVDANGDLIDPNTTLTATGVDYYRMNSRIYVGDGQTLNIGEGVVFKAEKTGVPETEYALIVSQGGTINAVGTAENPIIFTSIDDPLDGTYSVLNKERWGGVIILGKAYNNVAAGDINPEELNSLIGVRDGLAYVEGLDYPDPRHWYGAYDFRDSIVFDDPSDPDGDTLKIPLFDDNDNSGRLSYVSIRHGGTDIGEANEINGLTLGSVGRNTQIDHIEIVSNGDDGVEFFGGTASIKYLSVMFCEDDYLDWDQGWDGSAQFILGVQLPPTTGTAVDPESPASYGDNGFECDGDDGERDASKYWLTKVSAPTVYNATIIGSDDAGDKGLELKERTQGLIANSVFARFGKSIDVEMFSEDKEQTGCDGFLLDDGTLQVVSNTFLNCGGPSIADSVEHSGAKVATRKDEVLTYLTNNNNVEVRSNEVIDDLLTVAVSGEGTAQTSAIQDRFNATPVAGLAAIESNVFPLPTGDAFFSSANYRGAFQPDSKAWTEEWSYHEVLGSSFVNCPADVNNDRDINVDDFTDFAVKFGQSCDEAY